MTVARLLSRLAAATVLATACSLGAAAIAGVHPRDVVPALPDVLPQAADDEPAVRIMLAGDSITQGQIEQPTYRLYVDRELRRQEVDFDFVGSRSATRSPGGWYLDPDFDRDHWALAGTTFAAQVPKAAVEVRREQPDLMVLELGINDLRDGATPEQVNALFAQFVAEVRAGKPDTRMLVLPVLTQSATGARPNLNADVVRYNQLATQTAAGLSTEGSPVEMVPQQAGWDPITGTIDGLHPSVEGETYVAQLVVDALYRVGVLPGGAPSIFVELAPAPTPAPAPGEPTPAPAQPSPAPPSAPAT